MHSKDITLVLSLETGLVSSQFHQYSIVTDAHDRNSKQKSDNQLAAGETSFHIGNSEWQ